MGIATLGATVAATQHFRVKYSRYISLWKSSHCHEKSHAILDHTVLPDPGSSDFPAFTTAKAGTRFNDPDDAKLS